MNDQKLDIIINLLKQGTGGREAAQELSQLDESQKKASKSSAELSSLMTSLKATVAGLGIAAVIRESVIAFEQQEQAVAKLDGTLRAAGRYTAEFSKEMQGLADSLEGVTRFDDAKILGSITQLLSAGAGKSEIERLTKITLDFAAAMGTDAESAAVSLGKALQGEFAAFQRFGIQIDESKGKADQLADVLTQLEGRFKGIAEAQGGTASGAMVQFKNNVDELKKSLGALVVEMSNPVLSTINQSIKFAGRSESDLPAQRAAIIQQIEALRGKGTIGFKDADAMMSDLQASANPVFTRNIFGGQDRQNGSLFGQYETIDALTAKLASLQSGGSSGSGAGAVSAGDGDTAGGRLAIEDRKKGLQELAKLQVQISVNSLDGFDKERAAALATYDERIKALDKIKATGVDVAEAMAQAEQERSNKINAIWAKEEAQLDAKAQKEVDAQQKANGQIIDLREQLALAAASGYDREFLAAEQGHNQIIEQIRALAAEKRISAEEEAALQDLAAQGYELQTQAIGRTIEEMKRQKFWLSDTGQLITQINQQFASGFSRAFVDFASGSKTAEEAFKEFGASFLQMVAQMIVQMLVLRAISGIFGAAAGGASGVAGGIDGAAASPMAFGTPIMAANGGQFPRMMASGGMQGMVSQATYLSRFNAIAGEAGPELLTVMARPRMFDIGGMTATVGDVGGSRMAVVPERALAGASGSAEIIVRMEPGLRGEIVSDAITGAAVRLTNDAGRATPFSGAIKKLVA